MGVQVDEPGRHELAGSVEDALRARWRDVGLERLDHAEADSDVALSAQILAGIKHVAALDHQVELIVRAHGGARRSARCGSEGERTGGCEKLATRGGHGLPPCIFLFSSCAARLRTSIATAVLMRRPVQATTIQSISVRSTRSRHCGMSALRRKPWFAIKLEMCRQAPEPDSCTAANTAATGVPLEPAPRYVQRAQLYNATAGKLKKVSGSALPSRAVGGKQQSLWPSPIFRTRHPNEHSVYGQGHKKVHRNRRLGFCSLPGRQTRRRGVHENLLPLPQ